MILNEILINQYEAAMATLWQGIIQCPEDKWNSEHPDSPFSRVVFHTLIFVDVYLGRDENEIKYQAFHKNNKHNFKNYEELEDRIPSNMYDREFIEEYFEFCLEKLREQIPGEDSEVLYGESGFSYRKFTRLELHLYSIRHIQHHAAQLGLRNQLETGIELEWNSSGFKKYIKKS